MVDSDRFCLLLFLFLLLFWFIGLLLVFSFFCCFEDLVEVGCVELLGRIFLFLLLFFIEWLKVVFRLIMLCSRMFLFRSFCCYMVMVLKVSGFLYSFVIIVLWFVLICLVMVILFLCDSSLIEFILCRYMCMGLLVWFSFLVLVVVMVILCEFELVVVILFMFLFLLDFLLVLMMWMFILDSIDIIFLIWLELICLGGRMVFSWL